MAILHSLWEACGVAAEAPERSGLVKLMGGPLRLHTRSLERCMAEVRRCEEAKVAQMLEIVNDKARCGGFWGVGAEEGTDGARLKELGVQDCIQTVT